MNRRGHLSRKIPNAKNRPAPIGHSRRKEIGREKSPLNAMDEEMLERAWAGAEEDSGPSTSSRRSEQPWNGFVMTFTGVESKQRLTEMANQLGAVVEAALTTAVTHLIASGYDSPKYHYAVEHKLPVLTPSWIQMAHAMWLKGEEWDDEHLAQGHRLLPFTGLKITMSGIEPERCLVMGAAADDPVDKRKALISLIEEYGGEYSKDLDRSCTHLIAAKYTAERGQSEKVKWALKELASREMAKRNGKEAEGEALKIVYEEWVWDCVGHGGRWKEESYDANKIRRNGKVKPEDVMNGIPPIPAVPRALIDEKADVEAEPAMIRKRKRNDLDLLVEDIVSLQGQGVRGPKGAIKVEATRLDLLVPDSDFHDSSRSPSADPDGGHRASRPRTTGTGTGKGQGTGGDRKPSMLHISRTASFGGVKAEPVDPLALATGSTSIERTGAVKAEGDSAASGSGGGGGGGEAQIFQGLRIGHAIAEECEGLERALIAHGAMLVKGNEKAIGADMDYLIVRLTSPTRPDISHLANPPVIVTECWVEGCCFEKRLLPLDRHIVFRPLAVPVPIPGIERCVIHLSSLSIENAVFMKRLVRALGGTLSLKMNKHTTHLVSGVSTSQKVEKAHEWGIKIVTDGWLLAMASSGQLEDESFYSIGAGIQPDVKPVLLAGDRGEGTGTPQVLVANSSQSSRALRPTPTHIDDLSPAPLLPGVPSRSAEGSGSGPASPLQHALSPPKASTHRLLNSATSLRPSGSPKHESDLSKSQEKSQGEGSDAKLGRTTSAPPASFAQPRGGTHLEPGRKEEMYSLLRHLTDRSGSPSDPAPSPAAGAAGGGIKPVRRRPTSRLSKSTTGPWALGNTSTSPKANGAGTPPLAGYAEVDMDHSEGMLDHLDPEAEQETLRVYHRDPNAEKERKRLEDALKRGARGLARV